MEHNIRILGRLAAAVALGASLLLSGCGLKGPLYLPAPAQATPQPAPAASQ
ncbi:LPS translocon maturation chaperone LptM [Aquabacterium parvum]|uniref:LPS translocon maturation chaperone LptM n=1 Tax=Aquabacterium parvum TaxID=70584 RepID=UPI0009FACDB7|nr:lipoprotein [Gammaproteobacteria bacterium]